MSEQTVWITGATAGIGKALALAYAQKGARLVLSARREKLLAEVREACLTAGSPHTAIYSLDLADSTAIDCVAAQVLQEQGRVDVLINNAGISQRSRIIDTEMSVYRRLIEIDYLAQVQLTKALLPQMIKQGGAQVVVISSLVGKFATPLRSGYAAAKHALHGFFDALRAEHYQDNIAVTLICPGFIKTEVSVNALTANGAKQNVMDAAQKNGMLPTTFARLAIRAIERKTMEVNIGGKETLGVWLMRFFPRAFKKYLRKAPVT